MTITPSCVARAPASLMSRIATSFGRLGEPRASNRSSTALATLLTFCPPGPEARTKLSSSSPSGISMAGVTNTSVPEVFVLQRHLDAGAAQQRHRGLQIVTLLAADAQLVALDLRL